MRFPLVRGLYNSRRQKETAQVQNRQFSLLAVVMSVTRSDSFEPQCPDVHVCMSPNKHSHDQRPRPWQSNRANSAEKDDPF